MPTGNTSDLYDGKDVTLRDYLMRVGRGMGYAIMQRDDAWEAPVRRVEPHTSYHDERLEAARQRTLDLDAMSPADVERAAREDFDARLAAWEEGKAKNAALRERYEDMLAQVEAWDPDPLMEGTKEYAIRQLKESIDFDCGDDDRWNPRPTPQEPDEWLAAQQADAHREIEYHTRERRLEVERAEERNRYIDAFYASLPVAVALEGEKP